LKFKAVSVGNVHHSVFSNETDEKYEFYITRNFATLVSTVGNMKGATDMKCPVCKTPDLLLSEREGIEIDYCSTCRGIWLDRGELDKLLARMENAAPARRDHAHEAHGGNNGRDRHDEWRSDGHSHDGHRGRHHSDRKKKSLLGDLFDFG
jgi:Zn-finger nucleic acid-binding protein